MVVEAQKNPLTIEEIVKGFKVDEEKSEGSLCCCELKDIESSTWELFSGTPSDFFVSLEDAMSLAGYSEYKTASELSSKLDILGISDVCKAAILGFVLKGEGSEPLSKTLERAFNHHIYSTLYACRGYIFYLLSAMRALPAAPGPLYKIISRGLEDLKVGTTFSWTAPTLVSYSKSKTWNNLDGNSYVLVIKGSPKGYIVGKITQNNGGKPEHNNNNKK